MEINRTYPLYSERSPGAESALKSESPGLFVPVSHQFYVCLHHPTFAHAVLVANSVEFTHWAQMKTILPRRDELNWALLRQCGWAEEARTKRSRSGWEQSRLTQIAPASRGLMRIWTGQKMANPANSTGPRSTAHNWPTSSRINEANGPSERWEYWRVLCARKPLR
ncbi:unnamed protein product [Protopolystoma xenopodis]|uniref:Uncharacterized protein n=1 Tax=Protopolystoma xenopodis TaxID=117903 RepID=A0A3S5CNA2_9PLAT|nr:unnamed protein product [Protopolystoma xenopodis]